ncbi:hypothetical protein BOTBODRAFT_31834 [Botryobasidium botryosum FD-172 SS1]|uniref:SET domain-containing protein n=1 Tax=Botryobasidium botryosum (strain FD-172 SS1) TaxID=930990 RepID=A0A067MIZ8_BOTB1|nr:hypothetical protein BOTBODRAFT_31834 [Botryobasidium botryosum FD-172 SS1]
MTSSGSTGWMTEPAPFTQLRAWAAENGAYIHPSLVFVEDTHGTSAYATEDIDPEETIVSCPFSLAITPEIARYGIAQSFNTGAPDTSQWNERQTICTYLVMHWVMLGELFKHEAYLRHGPYLRSLPRSAALLTPLYFSPSEFALLRGTNLYGATTDRKNAWEAEWRVCREAIAGCNKDYGEKFNWERYLSASTYLSSRAFPSTLLSENPSITSSDSSHPVLLPIVDSLNHARGHQVSWVVSPIQKTEFAPGDHVSKNLQINLIIRSPTAAREQLFNNYGPKPNAELLLAYGFVIPDNPDDTIVLKLGGSDKRWEVGREAKGIEGVWDEVKSRLSQDAESEEEEGWAVSLDVAEMLEEMVWQLVKALPKLEERNQEGVRSEVALMVRIYVKGQMEILTSILEYAARRKEEAIEEARQSGVELDVLDEREEED